MSKGQDRALERIVQTLHGCEAFKDHYRILSPLGVGGMGAVFLGVQKDLDRKVAIKCVERSAFGCDVDTRRFRREAAVLATLSHPGIVEVYTFGEAGPFLYIVSEFVEGSSLRQRLRQGAVPVGEACSIVVSVASAVQISPWIEI